MKKVAQGFNTAAQDSNPDPPSRESEALPLSHCALIALTNCYVCNVFTCRWGSKLVIVASQQLRNRALYGREADINMELPMKQFCFLERIGR